MKERHKNKMNKFWSIFKFKKSQTLTSLNHTQGLVAYYLSQGVLYFLCLKNRRSLLTGYHELVANQSDFTQRLTKFGLNIEAKILPGTYHVTVSSDKEQTSQPQTYQFALVRILKYETLNNQSPQVAWLTFEQACQSLKSQAEIDILTMAYKMIRRAQI